MSYLFIFGVVICMVSFNTHACVHIASPTAKLQVSSASINSEEASKPGDSSKCCSSLPSDTLETGVIRNVNHQKVKNKWQPQQQIWAQQNICVTLLSSAQLGSENAAVQWYPSDFTIGTLAFQVWRPAHSSKTRLSAPRHREGGGKGQRMCLTMGVYCSVAQKNAIEKTWIV